MGKNASNPLILVLDKQGIIGKSILAALSNKKTQGIFVSGDHVLWETKPDEVFWIQYRRKIPLLPDATYSHIVVVYQGEKEEFSVLEPLLKKAEEQEAKFILILPISLKENTIVDFVLKSYKNSYVIYIGDIFSRSEFQKQTTIAQFFDSAKNSGSIIVSGMGLQKTYPVFLEDAALAILEVMFDQKGKERIFFLFPKHPITKLSLARMFQKIDPTLRIDFVGEEKEDIYFPEKEGKYLLQQNYPLPKHIKDVYEAIPEGKMPKIQADTENVSRERLTITRKLAFLSSYFLLVFLLLPILSTLFFSFLGQRQLMLALAAFQKGNFADVKNYAQAADTLFSNAYQISEMVIIEASFIRLEESAMKLKGNIHKGQNAASILLGFANTSQSFSKGEGASVALGLRQAGVIMQELQLNNYDNLLSVIDVLPDLLGFWGKRVYLVLFQNNMELRPAGGFIGSFATATLDKGKLMDFAIHDVYDADGQLKGHVEPPYAIRRHLPSVHWYLRDSNFNVDFIKSASASSFFLKTETGTNVDGVIALDVSFVKALLSAIGPIEVSDYKETVTAENLYLLAQKHSQEDFFPGSNQKKDFLRSLFQTVQLQLNSGQNVPYEKVLKGISQGVREKHVLFAFANSNIQNVFTVNRMSSSLWDAREKSTDDFYDFLGVNEANLGVNKVNYFVERNVQHNVTVSTDGVISEKLIIKYKNNSQDKTLEEDYKNYLRLILPLGTKLSGITIDNVQQNIVKAVTDPSLYEGKRFVKPAGLEVEQAQQDSKTLFGFLLTVPQGKEITITISYELPKKEPFNKNQFNYNLWLFKQPGIDDYDYEFSFDFPETMRVIKTSSNASLQEGRISMKKTIAEDEQIDISFAKN